MFTFKQFRVSDSRCAMKVGTDGVLLGAWVTGRDYRAVIDAGSGSGLLSLMMAQRFPQAEIIGVDIDANACLDAEENVADSPWKDRIHIRCGDVLDMSRDNLESPLLLISNPPFFNEELHSPIAGRAIARHGEGFDIESLIRLGGKFLRDSEDRLAFIAPSSRSGEIELALALSRLNIYRKAVVYSREGRPSLRTLYQVGKGSVRAIEEEVIYIRNASNQLSEQYKELTAAFYLDK